MGNDSEKNSSENELVYLLCPYCFLKIPQMEVYVENSIPKIKLLCNCTQSQDANPIFQLSEYIDKLRYRDKLLIKCSNHTKVEPIVFCVNCEKWLCEKCVKNKHTKQSCAYEFNIVNYYPPKCSKHTINDQISYCKKCKELLCNLCSSTHISSTSKNQKHSIIEYSKYLDEHKMASKLKKVKVFREQARAMIEKIKNELDERIKNNNNKVIPLSREEISNLNEAYKQNRENNDILIEFIEIMFNNIKSIPYREKAKIWKEITNKKVILNFIKNTSISHTPEKVLNIVNSKNNLKEDIATFTKFLYTIFFNFSVKFQMIKFNEYYSNEQLSLACKIDDNTLAISAGTSIIILNSNTVKKTSVFRDHTNTITSLLADKDGNLISGSNDRTIKKWNIQQMLKLTKDLKSIKEETKKKEIKEQMQQCITSITVTTIPELMILLTNYHNKVAFVGIEKRFEVWNFETKKCEREKKIQGDYIFESIGQLKNGNILLGNENSILIINSKSLDVINEIKNMEDMPKVFLELNNGNIAVGFKRIGIIIYNKNFEKIQSLIGHKKVITGLVEMEDDLLISSSNDLTLRFWDMNTYICLEVVFMGKDEITSIEKAGNNKLVLLKGEKIAEVWKIEKT